MAHSTAGLLLAMVGGYWVLERAAGHKGRLKQVGQVVGTVILVVSLVGIACRVWYLAAGQRGDCPLPKRFCPYEPPQQRDSGSATTN